jgi:LmbE family N-acetylglucosaminyl deacetylase
MPEPRTLLCVMAHPDDESLGTGGILARYAAEGVTTHLITATRGERGWTGPAAENPGLTALGRIREAELRAAAAVLGLREVTLLDYIDGDLDRAAPPAIIAELAGHIRRIRPQVVVTFDPNGAYGHPDHIAICQFTTAALVAAADASYPTSGDAYRVAKLYYMADGRELLALYESVFGELVMEIDGVDRRFVPWEEWAVTTEIDCTAYWPQVRQAVLCHRSQLPEYGKLVELPDAQQVRLWGYQRYYRAYSLVNGGRARETDLFAGLRDAD